MVAVCSRKPAGVCGYFLLWNVQLFSRSRRQPLRLLFPLLSGGLQARSLPGVPSTVDTITEQDQLFSCRIVAMLKG